MDSITPINNSGKPLRGLIIEDNDTDYLLLERHLQKMLPTISCVRAENRAQVTAALTQPIDLIVTDYHLLDIEGNELLTTITGAQGNTPCILLSGSLYELDQVAAPHNVTAKLEKGDIPALRSALERIVKNIE